MEQNPMPNEREDWLARERTLIGDRAVSALGRARVMVLGLGGVGSYAVEALVRAGVGELILLDHDRVSVTNINRQLIADTETVGRLKTDVCAERCRRIAPDCRVVPLPVFCDAANLPELLETHRPSYIIDAIDTVASKLAVIAAASERGIPVISCMGTGNHLDPGAFRIAPIEKTDTCPLARVMRLELRRRGIRGVPVLYSTEAPVSVGSRTPASISFVPGTAGLMLAGYVIRFLTEEE